jgi:hypothetical protein
MLLFLLFLGSEHCKFEKMSHRQCSENYIVQMLDECDLSDLEDVLSESDEFIPHGDASGLEDNTNSA